MKNITFLILVLFVFSCKQLRQVRDEDNSRSMFGLSEAERRQKLEDDLILLKRYDDGLGHILRYAKRRADLFPKDVESDLNAAQRDELREIFAGILDYMRAIDGMKNYWKDFHKYGSIIERRAHSESFLISYVAWLVQYRHGLAFVDLTVPSLTMEKILDEESVKFEIPKESFKSLKWQIINVKSVTKLMGTHQYFKTLKGAYSDNDCIQRESCNWAFENVDVYHYSSKDVLKDRGPAQFSYNAFDIARDLSFEAWFPVQKNVAEWMGDTKVRRLHRSLISKKDLKKMRKKMRPGDIIVTRSNWYLSNIGLPGFWPHAELYLGDESELDSAFSSPELKAFLKREYGEERLAAVLKSKFAIAWTAYKEKRENEPSVIIEAVSEGVKFSTISEACGADYVGVIRPKRTEIERAKAILTAFSKHGLPYDFNFDFATDETLVCTELVYKAYQPTDNFRGIDFPTTRVMGRNTLPANDLIKFYATTGSNEFEFVYFLDGVEKSESAVVSTEAQFKQSWKRPKWDVVQK